MESSTSINTPHPDATPDDAEAFFGGDDRSAAELDAEGAEYRESHGEPDPNPDTLQTGEQTVAAREQAAAAGEPDPAPAPAAEAVKGGNLEREYIVFQKTTLTEKVLRHLLGEIETGNSMPRIAFFELARKTTRNDRQAIGEAYASHKDELGDKCVLAAVSHRAFKERTIQPEEVPAERRIRIS